MTLIGLQKVLSDRIQITLSDMTEEETLKENERTALIINLSKQMIANQNTIMKAATMVEDSMDLRKKAVDLAFIDRG
jgi:hypothetical protein